MSLIKPRSQPKQPTINQTEKKLFMKKKAFYKRGVRKPDLSPRSISLRIRKTQSKYLEEKKRRSNFYNEQEHLRTLIELGIQVETNNLQVQPPNVLDTNLNEANLLRQRVEKIEVFQQQLITLLNKITTLASHQAS